MVSSRISWTVRGTILHARLRGVQMTLWERGFRASFSGSWRGSAVGRLRGGSWFDRHSGLRPPYLAEQVSYRLGHCLLGQLRARAVCGWHRRDEDAFELRHQPLVFDHECRKEVPEMVKVTRGVGCVRADSNAHVFRLAYVVGFVIPVEDVDPRLSEFVRQRLLVFPLSETSMRSKISRGHIRRCLLTSSLPAFLVGISTSSFVTCYFFFFCAPAYSAASSSDAWLLARAACRVRVRP